MLEEWKPEGWVKTKLEDISKDFGRGKSKHRPRDDSILYGGKYPFVQTGDVKASNGRIMKYTQTYNELGLEQSKLWPKDTLCITIAANIAETGILEFPACFPDSIIGFVADGKKTNVFFVGYLLKYVKYYIQSEYIGTGTAQDNINLGTFDELKFPIPSIPIQNKILNILKPIDDKIFSLQNQNKILEKIAQAIFKSWFVDFDGHTEFQDSELGQIPKRWNVDMIKNIFRLEYGWHLPTWERKSGNVPVYGSGGLTGFNNKSLVKGPGIIVGRAGKVGKDSIYYSHRNFCPIETTFYVKTQNEILIPYIYHFLKGLQTMDTGTSVPNLSRAHVHNLKIIIPKMNILQNFYNITEPHFSKILENNSQIDILEKIRDTLLPKLMLGEIRV